MATWADAFHTSSRQRRSQKPRHPQSVAGQLRPAGVAHSSQHRPAVHRKIEQRSGQRGDQTAVRDQHHRPVGFLASPIPALRQRVRRPAARCERRRRCGSPRRAAPTRHRRARPAAPPARWRRPAEWVIPCQSPRWVSRSRMIDVPPSDRCAPRASAPCRRRGADPRTRSAAAVVWRAPRRRPRPGRGRGRLSSVSSWPCIRLPAL